MRVLERPSLEAYLFALVGIAAAAFPMTWYFRLFLVLVLAGIIIDLIIRSPWTASWLWRPKAFCIIAAISLLGAAAWRPITDDYRGTEKPDVTLGFVNPRHPLLQLENISGTLAQQIKFSSALWNLDTTDPDPKNPLQIPVQTFDFIRARQISGRQNIFQSVQSTIKPGNRLFGSVSANCPACARGHTIWVYIVWGESGWYSEVPDLKEGELLIPKDFEHVDVKVFAEAMIAKIPADKRVSIPPVE